MNSLPLKILYTNWKGVTSIRYIIPQEIYFDNSEWYEGDQWLMDAIDVDKNAQRTFAMSNISFIYGEDDENEKKINILKREFLE